MNKAPSLAKVIDDLRVDGDEFQRVGVAFRARGMPVGPSTYIHWIRTGKLVAIRRGGFWFTTPLAVERFLEESNPQLAGAAR